MQNLGGGRWGAFVELPLTALSRRSPVVLCILVSGVNNVCWRGISVRIGGGGTYVVLLLGEKLPFLACSIFLPLFCTLISANLGNLSIVENCIKPLSDRMPR